MKILWITNIMLPPISEKLGLKPQVVGGWLYSSAKRLLKFENVELSVACTSNNVKELIEKEIDGVRYFVLPLKYRSPNTSHGFIQKFWKQINNELKPDVVHLHGTEFAHGLDFIKVNGSKNVVVSIQGLVSIIGNYYYGGLRYNVVKKYFTLVDLLRCNTIVNARKKFINRGKIERKIIEKVNHVIGRTEWDKAHVWEINPDARYHFCSETLRDEFYKHKWSYDNCERYSIFVSQSAYPIKGLHQILEALPIVLKYYPMTKVYVAGKDVTKKNPWYRYVGYGKYIRHLINKHNLKGHVIFTGSLDEKHMCERYLKSNLFISPSSIENSSNSLGEAQLLGMPYLASYVGGTMDLVGSNTNSLYRFEETVMLAKKICEIFEKDTYISNREEIIWRYDAEKNIQDLISIYINISGYVD